MSKWGHVNIYTRRMAWCLLFLLVGANETVAQTENKLPPKVETIIRQMAQARSINQAMFRHYIVTREYKLFGKEKLKTKCQVIAKVIFNPPDHKKYTIQQVHGKGLGERIVRRMLDSEAEIMKDNSLTDIATANYVFSFFREEEVDNNPCYVLGIQPRRKEKNLLRGSIWVDARTYLLRRAEGIPAKAVSWWIRDMSISFHYGEVQGMWLQTAMEATANVRIIGPYTMVSRDINYEISELAAVRTQGTVSR